jgi:hypothetical protein
MANPASRIALALLLSVLLSRAAAAQKCGVERWPVKTMTDKDSGDVDMTPAEVTVGELLALPQPGTQLPQSNRVAPTELSVFRIRALVTEIKKEKDGDYHLILADPDDPESTMLAEVPDEKCAKGSGFEATFKSIRAKLEPYRKKKNLEQLIEIDGVGFFDFLHNQTGVARNGIELHPILKVSFIN